jgi:purine-nucleoside phosphorylase
LNYKNQVEEAVRYLAKRTPSFPEIIIQLGTGLGAVCEAITNPQIIPYSDIPHFQESTVDSHAGNLILGSLARKEVAVLQGRMHYYEGYSTQQITLPIRVLALLGGKQLIICNAAGGLKQSLTAGSLMLITDHINLMGENPLRGVNVEAWGPRFPDLSDVYSLRLADIARNAAKSNGIKLNKGVYVAIAGPSLETPAETRFLQKCGADAVGMSTVPEVIVAKHAGLEVLGISVIANNNDPDNFQAIILQDILTKMTEVEPILKKLIVDIVSKM